MEGRYGMYSRGSSGWTSMRSEELQEEDVWSVLKGKNREETVNPRISHRSSTIVTPRSHLSASRMIPMANTINSGSGGGSKANIAHEPKVSHQSAPVNIPDWSKIYGGKSSTSSKRPFSSWLQEEGEDENDGSDAAGAITRSSSLDSDDDENEDGGYDEDRVPPHEWIARKLARSHISSFSVFEGIGRTLKGRDLSRVRNIVLTKTGFLE